MTIDQGLRALSNRSNWVRWLLLAYVAAIILTMPLALTLAYLTTERSIPPEYLSFFMLFCMVVGFALFVGLAITIPLWTYRAWANLHAMGLQNLGYSPGWAAGSFFVPIVNLFVPFFAMRQLANRSAGEEDYHANASVGDVTSWWACYLGGNFIQMATVFIELFNTNGLVLIVAHPVIRILTSLFGIALMLGSAWFLFRVVSDITRAQTSYTGVENAFA